MNIKKLPYNFIIICLLLRSIFGMENNPNQQIKSKIIRHSKALPQQQANAFNIKSEFNSGQAFPCRNGDYNEGKTAA